MKEIETNRLFVFGGAYSNLAATQEVFDQAQRMGFTPSQILFTGDSVAYCADPEETARLIAKSGIHVLKGNCEEALANDADNCGCGFEEGTECDILADQWYNYCRQHISQETAHWMAGLPDKCIVNMSGFKMLAVHATPSSNNQFVFPSSLSHKTLMHDNMVYDGYIAGHSGIPFIGKVGKSIWLNSGASGMPANDGTARVWYATIEIKNDILMFETHALVYDHAHSINAMRESGLENGYMTCLRSGIWPSHDVLPPLELSDTGNAISPQKHAQLITPLVSA